MRFLRPLLAGFALLACAAAARAGEAPVRLLAPAAGATLQAGGTAELAWEPGAELSELSRVEEWEAFLSLDGGATYTVRITPHLDQDLRRVTWRVPPVPTADARLLLRFGDERRETAVELPGRFAIALPAVDPGLPLAAAAPVHPAGSAGEPALPGRPGVALWVEGSRRGKGLRRVAAAAAASLDGTPAVSGPRGEPALLVQAPDPPQPSVDAPREGEAAPPAGGGRSTRLRAGTAPLPPSDILLLIQRQNE